MNKPREDKSTKLVEIMKAAIEKTNDADTEEWSLNHV